MKVIYSSVENKLRAGQWKIVFLRLRKQGSSDMQFAKNGRTYTGHTVCVSYDADEEFSRKIHTRAKHHHRAQSARKDYTPDIAGNDELVQPLVFINWFTKLLLLYNKNAKF